MALREPKSSGLSSSGTEEPRELSACKTSEKKARHEERKGAKEDAERVQKKTQKGGRKTQISWAGTHKDGKRRVQKGSEEGERNGIENRGQSRMRTRRQQTPRRGRRKVVLRKREGLDAGNLREILHDPIKHTRLNLEVLREKL